MYKGRHLKTGETKRGNKFATMLASLVLLLTVTIGATLAVLVTNTDAVENVFLPAKAGIEIVEDFDGSEKKSVQIQNTGDADVYVRVALLKQKTATNEGTTTVVNGMMLGEGDVTVGKDWVLAADGYYYYLKRVGTGEAGVTANLLGAPLKVEKDTVISVLAQAIQADGVDAKGNKPIELAWGVDIEGGQLKDATIVTQ